MIPKPENPFTPSENPSATSRTALEMRQIPFADALEAEESFFSEDIGEAAVRIPFTEAVAEASHQLTLAPFDDRKATTPAPPFVNFQNALNSEVDDKFDFSETNHVKLKVLEDEKRALFVDFTTKLLGISPETAGAGYEFFLKDDFNSASKTHEGNSHEPSIAQPQQYSESALFNKKGGAEKFYLQNKDKYLAMGLKYREDLQEYDPKLVKGLRSHCNLNGIDFEALLPTGGELRAVDIVKHAPSDSIRFQNAVIYLADRTRNKARGLIKSPK